MFCMLRMPKNEEKSEDKIKMKKGMKQVKKGIALFLAAALLATGCGKTVETDNEPARQEKQEVTTKNGQTGKETAQGSSDVELIQALRAKYNAGTIDYSGDTISVDRDESIEIELGYNPYVDSSINLWDSFLLYQDAGLEYPVESANYDWDESSGILTIEPPMYGPAGQFQMEIDHASNTLLENNDGSGWGNLSQLYLATKVDVETGEPITGNPLVTVVKVNTEITQAPQVKFNQDENGYARFSWKEVPGAQEYFLFTINKADGAWNDYINVIAATDETEWTVDPSMSIDGTEVITINDRFTRYTYEEDYGDYPVIEEYMGVIAVSDTGNSHISNLFDCYELAHMLPYGISYDVNEEMNDISCEGTLNLPTMMAIDMCDGSISQRVIEYDKGSIDKTEEGFYYTIECKAYGTPFTDRFLVLEQDWDTLEQELDAVLDRQEKLMNKGGNVEADISFLDGEEDTAATEENAEDSDEISELPQTEETTAGETITESETATEDETVTQNETVTEEESMDEESSMEAATDTAVTEEETQQVKPAESLDGKITANSALSEYLAIQMLNSEQQIDISAFPESADTALVVDAFLEAQYQNPLILGIKEVGMDTANSILYVGYDYDAQTTEAKRREVEKKAEQIISEIITNGMSDLEKELAINQYLCDIAEYDNGALENAAENDFKYVDEQYNDSFTAYGVLMNHVGVCASYSAAFKLLADAAELESVVVTGYLEGNLPHAWNKVRIDGQWNIVDSTNNDNEVIQNALLNLSDTAAYTMLVEDDRFVLDDYRYDYDAPSDENEYYRITDRYFTMDEITDMLVEAIQSEGSAILRTEYDLDDTTFHMIAQETANGAQADIAGFHWMGVICLEQR